MFQNNECPKADRSGYPKTDLRWLRPQRRLIYRIFYYLKKISAKLDIRKHISAGCVPKGLMNEFSLYVAIPSVRHPLYGFRTLWVSEAVLDPITRLTRSVEHCNRCIHG